MQRTFVLDKNEQPIMPCHPARARMLVKQGKAAIYRLYPFTIILKERESGNVQLIEVKIDNRKKPDVWTWSGGLTKFNRTLQSYRKDHYIDAACVGESGASVKIHPQFSPLEITAMGRGCMDGYMYHNKPQPKGREVSSPT